MNLKGQMPVTRKDTILNDVAYPSKCQKINQLNCFRRISRYFMLLILLKLRFRKSSSQKTRMLYGPSILLITGGKFRTFRIVRVTY